MKEMTDNKVQIATPQQSEGMLDIVKANAEAMQHMEVCFFWRQTNDVVTVRDVNVEGDDAYHFFFLPSKLRGTFEGPGCGVETLWNLLQAGMLEGQAELLLLALVEKQEAYLDARIEKFAKMELEDLEKFVEANQTDELASICLALRKMPFQGVFMNAMQGNSIAQLLMNHLEPTDFPNGDSTAPIFFEIQM
ncbi:hypothetical protein KA089_00765 [Candidatus Woesebacteria bacterium]|nr:hypothetical protein [Candidatus Woesebacteria bacterium]